MRPLLRFLSALVLVLAPLVDLDAPPPPAVEVAVGTVETVASVSSGRARNWFFLAVLGVAAVLIVAKISREKDERVSIHRP